MYPCGYGYFPIQNNNFVFEIVRLSGKRIIHAGYLNKVFKTKEEACHFYSNKFPHMRKINVTVSNKSEFDPETKLAYIIREDHCIVSIP